MSWFWYLMIGGFFGYCLGFFSRGRGRPRCPELHTLQLRHRGNHKDGEVVGTKDVRCQFEDGHHGPCGYQISGDSESYYWDPLEEEHNG